MKFFCERVEREGGEGGEGEERDLEVEAEAMAMSQERILGKQKKRSEVV
jgi:hypothetical protein